MKRCVVREDFVVCAADDILRNNLSCTKTIIRNKKYQVLEKFIVQPFRLAVNQVINFFIGLCG